LNRIIDITVPRLNQMDGTRSSRPRSNLQRGGSRRARGRSRSSAIVSALRDKGQTLEQTRRRGRPTSIRAAMGPTAGPGPHACSSRPLIAACRRPLHRNPTAMTGDEQ
jgi:hypothetical protein